MAVIKLCSRFGGVINNQFDRLKFVKALNIKICSTGYVKKGKHEEKTTQLDWILNQFV